MTIKENDAPLVLEKSAVSFVLMGPLGDHRGVLARSNHDNVNLVGLDNPIVYEFATRRSKGLFSIWFGRERDAFVVHTKPITTINTISFDRRNTYLSFAWQGSATKLDRQRIEQIFSSMAPDLAAAIATGSTSSVEWQLAGLLFACEATTERRLSTLKALKWLVTVTTGVYMAFLAVVLVLSSKGSLIEFFNGFPR